MSNTRIVPYVEKKKLKISKLRELKPRDFFCFATNDFDMNKIMQDDGALLNMVIAPSKDSRVQIIDMATGTILSRDEDREVVIVPVVIQPCAPEMVPAE